MCVDELCRNPHAIAGLAHAAFQDVAHLEFVRDLAYVNRAVFVDVGGVARDDEQPADAGETGNQVLGNAVGEKACSGSFVIFSKGRTAIDGFVAAKRTLVSPRG